MAATGGTAPATPVGLASPWVKAAKQSLDTALTAPRTLCSLGRLVMTSERGACLTKRNMKPPAS